MNPQPIKRIGPSMVILISALLMAALLLPLGCASAPDIASTEKQTGERYSADEIRRQTVDQPFLISGDYFREREQQPQWDLNEIFSDSKSDEKRADAAEVAEPEISQSPEPQRAQENMASPPTPSTGSIQPDTPPAATAPPAASRQKAEALEAEAFDRPPLTIGLFFDPETIPDSAAVRVDHLMSAAAAQSGAILTDQEKIREVLSTVDCLSRKDLACVAQALAIYPGVRMLILFEAIELPERLPAKALMRMSLVDTGLSYRYPTIEITQDLENAEDQDRFLTGTLMQLTDFAIQKSRLMPWHCRAFSQDGDTWFITAGKRSGLKPGDRLSVSTSGRLVKSPTGLPAGWLPGDIEGKVKITRIFGDNLAACELTEGRGPEPEDILLFP